MMERNKKRQFTREGIVWHLIRTN